MNALPDLHLECPGEKTLILGVGNVLRGDDGIGPALIRNLQGKVGCGLIDCGETPENCLQKIIDFRPSTIIIVDAADWGGPAGEIRQVRPEEISNPSFSGHTASLGLCLDYLRAHLRARIIVIGVQSGKREFLDPISPEGKRALEILQDRLARLSPSSRCKNSLS